MTRAPGCFGSPLCYSDVSLPCTICPHRDGCAEKAEVVSKELRTTYGIDEAIAAANRAINRHKRKPVIKPASKPASKPPSAALPATPPKAAFTPATPPVPGALPVKSMDLKRKLDTKGINLSRAISRGVNPFEGRPPAFMQTMVDMLLKGSFTREEAITTLMHKHGWSQASASSHVGFVLPVFMADGVAKLDGNKVMRTV